MSKIERLLQSYKPDDVDKYIRTIISEFDGKIKDLETQKHSLVKDSVGLEDKVQKLTKEIKAYKSKEMLISDTLIRATESAENIIKSATKESEKIIQEAEHKANKLKEEALEELNVLKAEIEETENNRNRVIEEIKSGLNKEKEDHELWTASKIKELDEEYLRKLGEHDSVCAELNEKYSRLNNEYNKFKAVLLDKLEELKVILG